MGKLDDLRALSQRKKREREAMPINVVGLPDRNPLETIAVTGNTETDDAAEVATVANMLNAQQAAQEKVMDNGYWVALVFTTADQCKEFLAKAGWVKHGDSTGTYFDGICIAKDMGVDLTPESIRIHGPKIDNRLVKEVGTIE